MDLPNSITIDGVKVSLKEKPLDEAEGEFSPVEMTIYLSTTTNMQLTKRTLMHELTHAMIYISTRGLTDYLQQFACVERMEEILAEQIGERLYEVLAKNPKVRKFLWG